MHLSRSISLAAVACLVLATGCQKNEQALPVAQPASQQAPAPAPVASAAPAASSGAAFQGWIGTWNGPEGTYLKLAARPDARYDVAIHDLDGERTFEGVAGADHIAFARDGVQERIVATNGEATGMKWLADKSTCLTVKEGEGYCRD